jgi:hypothetical protein
MSLGGAEGEGGVGGIALLNDEVQHQTTAARRERHLVSVVRVSPIFDEDVRVRPPGEKLAGHLVTGQAATGVEGA